MREEVTLAGKTFHLSFLSSIFHCPHHSFPFLSSSLDSLLTFLPVFSPSLSTPCLFAKFFILHSFSSSGIDPIFFLPPSFLISIFLLSFFFLSFVCSCYFSFPVSSILSSLPSLSSCLPFCLPFFLSSSLSCYFPSLLSSSILPYLHFPSVFLLSFLPFFFHSSLPCLLSSIFYSFPSL